MKEATIPPRSVPAETGRAARLWQRVRKHPWGYLFIAPWIILYTVFGLYPLLLSFYLAFFTYSFVQPEDYVFVGLGNWISGLLDPLFWKGLFNILYNQSIFILLKNGLGLFAALLLYKTPHFGKVFRTIYFMPVVVSIVVLMTIGEFITSPNGPVQNTLLRSGILDQPVFWKFDRWLPMPIIAIINTWKWFGIATVILLAGLYSIDSQLYEAAAIDGASGWQQFRFITIPQLGPQLFFLFVVDVIFGLQMMTEVFTIGFDVYGGVNNQALTPVLYLYAQAFDRSNIGYASALGLLLALIILSLTLFQFKIFPSEER
jgi:ABC-type sugar transport system permease subunit